MAKRQKSSPLGKRKARRGGKSSAGPVVLGAVVAAVAAVGVGVMILPTDNKAKQQNHQAPNIVEGGFERQVNAPARWSQVKVGMSQQQVRKLCGAPMASNGEYWAYGSANLFGDGPPADAYVVFFNGGSTVQKVRNPQ